MTALRGRCDRIADAPHGGAPRFSLSPNLRSIPFQRYVVFYIAEGDDVRIERSARCSRHRCHFRRRRRRLGASAASPLL
ncbi:type II toxin-antitoxin system RelE/ParE family toxin, partial [Mesorhizobium sp. M2D.F.Ca.ET.140.01.1.1]|uniref:type II toxin-antitoxin system RelE/ParE family toxin n=1 Tax=Mesorhizobium sp. M2D.F.Ca.ET.140.01.1.1 TaxID=2496664 RepID=UPI001FE22BF4